MIPTWLIAALIMSGVVYLGNYFYFRGRPADEQSPWIKWGMTIAAFVIVALIGLLAG